MYRCHWRGYAMVWTPVQTLESKNRRQRDWKAVSADSGMQYIAVITPDLRATLLCAPASLSVIKISAVLHSTRWPWENCAASFLYPWLTLETQSCSGENVFYPMWLNVLYIPCTTLCIQVCVWYPRSYPFVMLSVVPVALSVCISVLVWGSSSKLYWPTW